MPAKFERSLAFSGLRRRLADPEPVMGIFCELPCPEAVEIIGLGGWDFTVVDCEHAPITPQILPGLVRASTAAGLPAVIRVPSNDAAAIQHALDAGAAGVQIPQIDSVEAARRAVAAARFHPLGRRGFNPFVRAADFSARPVTEFLEHSNAEVCLVLQIESAEGVESVDSILELPGIDVLFIGPYDLSQSLGIPGETTHPRIFEAAARIVASAGRRGVAVGAFSAELGAARRWIECGIRYLCYSVDSVLLLNAMRETVRSLKPAS